MDRVKVIPIDQFGHQFVPPEYLPSGKDEHYLRDEQLGPAPAWRNLRAHEIEMLVKNTNTCTDWGQFNERPRKRLGYRTPAEILAKRLCCN
jgi:hypothetical protein